MKNDILLIEWFMLVSAVFGTIAFGIACSWDSLLGVTMHHNTGYGWFQILVMAITGMYAGAALAIRGKLHDYQKKIHGMKQ